MQPSAKVVAEAADWAALLDGDHVSDAERAACEAWCGRDPTHRLVLDRMRGIDTTMAALDPAGRQALRRLSKPSAKQMRGAGAALSFALLLGLGWVGAQTDAVRQHFPDEATRIGEQRNVTLADGSTLAIDTDGALDVRLGSDRRTVRLFHGQILATVAADPARPFSVETEEGSATALGTAFVVRRDEGVTLVTVTHSRVEVCATARAACTMLTAGERARIAQGTVERLTSIDPQAAAAWSRGWIEADDRPLGEVLAELNRYRAAPIRLDGAGLAAIRVTGSYPVKDTERAVRAIAETVGLRVDREPGGGLRLTSR